MPLELHRNPWFSVFDRDGYFTVEYHQAHVIVLPLVDQQQVVMVRVKRPLMPGGTMLELPAGSCDAAESPAAGAARELAEETGIVVVAQRLQPLPSLAISPNRTPQLTHVFRVDLTRAEFDQRRAHDHEIEAVELLPLDEIVRRIAVGEVPVAAVTAVLATHLFSCSGGQPC